MFIVLLELHSFSMGSFSYIWFFHIFNRENCNVLLQGLHLW
nr:MAG TPA: hypothetical protein [Caudoviricetes sp.]